MSNLGRKLGEGRNVLMSCSFITKVIRHLSVTVADLCKADQPDYRVAIGVGVVLLILIIIVVVAYLISRKRRTDGYQTL